tara:strand:- start:54 stop:2006 length:1953 start_codon:yes stop_codon:yes gene_type:complete
MKLLHILVIRVFLFALPLHAQSYWGYGLQGGLSNCGYQVSQAEESSSYKDEIDELKKQMAEWKKEVSLLKREMSKEQTELRKHDTTLRGNFDPDVYTFIKSHFDSQNKCSEYAGQTAINTAGKPETATIGTAPQVNVDGAPVEQRKPNSDQPPRMSGSSPAGMKPPRGMKLDDEDGDETPQIATIEPARLAKEWGDVCDLQRDPKGALKSAICQKNYLMTGSKANRAECQVAVLNYPKSVRNIKNLKRDIEAKQEAIKAAQAQIPELQKSMKEEQAEARRQRIEEIREGGICVECLSSSTGQSTGAGGGNVQANQPNWGGVIGNSVMALLAYSSTKNFYGSMQDKNADLGYPTQLPMTSPFMAATPGIIGAIGAGLGQGSFGCAGNSGGIAGMGGTMGAYSALGGSGQIGGAFGTPQWAMNNQMGGGMYNQGVGSWGMNGPWGLSSTGLGMYPQQLLMSQLGMNNGIGNSMMNPYSLLGGNNYGVLGGAGISGVMGLGGAGGIMGLGGLSGLNGQSGLNGLSGLSGLMGLNGLSGLSGLNGLSGLGTSGLDSQTVQLQLQQQQQLMQTQIRAYENAIQKQKAVSGLQTELIGVIQRIQAIQNGTGSTSLGSLGSSTSYLGGYSLGGIGTTTYGTVGGLPSSTVPLPLTGR